VQAFSTASVKLYLARLWRQHTCKDCFKRVAGKVAGEGTNCSTRLLWKSSAPPSFHTGFSLPVQSKASMLPVPTLTPSRRSCLLLVTLGTAGTCLLSQKTRHSQVQSPECSLDQLQIESSF